jgi:hypothetical protein
LAFVLEAILQFLHNIIQIFVKERGLRVFSRSFRRHPWISSGENQYLRDSLRSFGNLI